MATKVVIPPTGQRESTGTIGIWFKQQGETVRQGESLCTVETEKASVEIEAPCDGVLKVIVCPRDSEVAVGQCIGIIAGPDEDVRSIEPLR